MKKMKLKNIVSEFITVFYIYTSAVSMVYYIYINSSYILLLYIRGFDIPGLVGNGVVVQ